MSSPRVPESPASSRNPGLQGLKPSSNTPPPTNGPEPEVSYLQKASTPKGGTSLAFLNLIYFCLTFGERSPIICIQSAERLRETPPKAGFRFSTGMILIFVLFH